METYICVFCGSSPGHPAEKYKQIAIDFVDACADRGYNLVTGGGTTGMMGHVARHAIQRGLKVVGIMPSQITQWERKNHYHDGLTELILTDGMAERKIRMVERSNAFAMIPGGIGSLDEFYEVLTGKFFGERGIHYPGTHSMPVAVFNARGFFSHHLNGLRFMKSEGFISTDVLDSLIVSQHAHPLLSQVEAQLQAKRKPPL